MDLGGAGITTSSAVFEMAEDFGSWKERPDMKLPYAMNFIFAGVYEF